MKNFDKAANRYDDHAHIQRHIGNVMIDKLQDLPFNQEPDCLIDLGSGTGNIAHGLKKKWPASTVIGMDLAHNMNVVHQQKHPEHQVITADAHTIPLANQSCDLVVSNLLWHWLDQPQKALHNIHRILKPKGWCLFATPGPNTLWEVKKAWHHIEHQFHFNPYPSPHTLIEQAKAIGIENPIIDVVSFEVGYKHPCDIILQIKSIGANTLQSSTQKRGLMTPRQAERLWQACKAFEAEDGRYVATWEIIFFAFQKSDKKTHTTEHPLHIPIEIR